ncbi:helix-turn-helix domain-containing protein [Tersicoccus sp. MR15.9]|uniref:TetR/AcrR family transcriptional regulator n=1 Tax=Tersicoccus mangrovi TaxID=3121635 RepID=UPI002FE5027F
MLAAAETLLAGTTSPAAVSMDEIAAAAGVGKGTLFRAFGSRDGLLDAVFASRLDPLRQELNRPGSPVGPDVPAADRLVGVLLLLLDFKLDNPRLTTAREMNGTALLQAPHYRWVHRLLQDLVAKTGRTADSADVAAHLLLGALRVEVITELQAAGMTREQLGRYLEDVVHRLVGPDEH